MKYCSSCGTPLQDEINFCPNCGAAQKPVAPVTEKPSGNSSALATLCILTILGSVFGIIKGLFYESLFSMASDFLNRPNYYMLGYLSALANIGTLSGAIFMLNRRKIGYNIYVISQLICIILVFVRMFNFSFFGDNSAFGDNHYFNTFSGFAAATFVVPGIVFIALYTALVRKQLQ